MGKRKKRKHISRKERLATLAAKRKRDMQLKQAIVHHNQANKKSKVLEFIQCAFEQRVPRKNTSYFQMLHQLFKQLKQKGSNKDERFKNLLFHLYDAKCFRILRSKEDLTAIAHIVMWSHEAQRDLLEWKPKSRVPHKQVTELAQFSFVKYNIPKVMHQVWYAGLGKQCYWYILLGRGQNPRKLPNLPIPLTKKMAAYFFKAPADFSVNAALRWSQIMAISKGNFLLADYLARGYLGRNEFQQEDFWLRFIHLCVNAANLSVANINLMIDYLKFEKEENEHFSMRGRTIQSITKQAEAWHVEQMRINQRGGKYVWESRNLIMLSKGQVQNLHIVELLSTRELAREGRKMRHCVSSYAKDCYFRDTGIFSLRSKDEYDDEQILATIEVDFRLMKIVQAKAKYNASIGKRTKEVLEEWAELNELSISKYL